MLPRLLACLLFLALPATASAVVQNDRSWSDQIAAAASRFIVLHDFGAEAVLDKETNLVWWRSPADHFADGHAFQGSVCRGSRVGGRMGWRMPSGAELLSLAAPGPGAGLDDLPPGHPFELGADQIFWTQDRISDTTSTRYAAAGFFPNGPNPAPTVSSLDAGATASVWCVRGPGAPFQSVDHP